MVQRACAYMKLAGALMAAAVSLCAQKPVVEGLAASPVRVIIFEDLECSDCAAFRKMLDEKILPTYGDRVAFVHRDFPLAKHPWARRAAIAARFFAEESPKLAVEYRRYTMAHQQETDVGNFDARLAAFAETHGVDTQKAVAALADPRYAELVERDYQEGVSRGVVHTPTVFVDGRVFIETFAYEDVAKALDETLARARN